MYFTREIETQILKSLKRVPVTALTGPRQCGKTTLAKILVQKIPKSIYLDLERPSDLSKLQNAEWFLSSQKGSLICIDEIQRRPDLFPLIRSLCDDWGGNGSFLILGSASRELLKQSSESLAGRISYNRMGPFLLDELPAKYSLERYLVSGGFPRSLLTTRQNSFKWREDFISTFLERDLLQWSSFSPTAMRRLWRMLAHVNGQTVNYSSLASSLGLSAASIKSYVDLLTSTYMTETIPPWFSNLGKRLVKAPKVYIADSGITSALLNLRSFAEISGHPVFGSIWEQTVLSHIRGWKPEAEIFFYRTSNGAEIDFVVSLGKKIFAVECKASYSPFLSKGNHLALEDIAPHRAFVVIPKEGAFSVSAGIEAVSLSELRQRLNHTP